MSFFKAIATLGTGDRCIRCRLTLTFLWETIDTHYGAIASKAVKLQPSELNVPDKGKAGFEKMFGESWDSAIAAGKVYNAKDGAAKLGLDSDGLNKKWSKLSRGKDLIKFGGGFYCGKVGDIYVMNGFYMR